MKKLKNISKTVGNRIRGVRIENELSQAKFGAQIGVSAGYVGMLENNRRKPSQSLIIAISSRFAVNENWLRTGRLG